MGVIHSATAIAEKYRVDLDHARNVAEVAVRLFDVFQADHGLGPRHRLLLRVAGLLHEVGGFVSSRAHHKHSEYLIANSEIFGLNRDEIAMVAQIARYHRRSVPRASHPAYMALPRESRVVVNKLAAHAARGRRPDPRPSPPGGRHPLPAPGRRPDRLACPRGRDLLLEERAVADQGRPVRRHLRRENPAGRRVDGQCRPCWGYNLHGR